MSKLKEYAGEKINTEYKGFKITGEEPYDGPDGFFIMTITTSDGAILNKNFNAPEEFLKQFNSNDRVSSKASIEYAKKIIDDFLTDREELLRKAKRFNKMMKGEESMNKISKLSSLVNEVSIDDLSSGFTRSKRALNNLYDVTSGAELIETKKGNYKVLSRVKGSSLVKGMLVLATYNKYNQAAMLYEILGVTDDSEKYGEGGVKFNSVKECLSFYKVSSLKELEQLQDKNEYGKGSYLVVKDLVTEKSGAWFYLFEGRWSAGSGAEPLSFYTIEKVASEAPNTSDNTGTTEDTEDQVSKFESKLKENGMKDRMDLISKIADRVLSDYPSVTAKKFDILMDIDYADQDIPLDLEGLLNSKPADFQHDIVGILKNFNRRTKKMDNNFVPRYAKKSEKYGENKMSRAGKFLSNLTKLPERYQLILEDLSKSSYKDLIPQDLAIVLTKMTACAAIGNDVTLYVKSGTGKDAAEGKNGKTTEQRTANDWTVAVYGGNVETSQPVVAVYNTKNKSSFTFSTSKENLKKLGESKVEKKKAKNEAFFNKTGEVNFETLANLKKELSGFGLKDGSDFRANLFGTNLELYLSMAADALPEQINDLINRYGFNKGEGSVEFKKELEIEPKKDEAPMEAKKKVVKKKILKKAPLASGKKSKGMKKF